MNLWPTLLVTTCLCLSVISCGPTRSAVQEKPDTAQKTTIVEGPKLVGKIASIPADKRFVLIQSYGKWELAAGAILTTRGPDERTANLRVTGETLGEFAAADLQSGTLEKGDAVYSQAIPPPPIPSPAPEPSKNESAVNDKTTPKTIKF
jgi:hypothetical protein